MTWVRHAIALRIGLAGAGNDAMKTGEPISHFKKRKAIQWTAFLRVFPGTPGEDLNVRPLPVRRIDPGSRQHRFSVVDQDAEATPNMSQEQT